MPAPPAQPTREVSATQERLFREIASAQLSDADIRSRLQRQSPAIEPVKYYGWLVQRLGAEATLKLSKAPTSVSDMNKALHDTQYGDAKSVDMLIYSLNPLTGNNPLPLGSYTTLDKTKRYLFLKPQLGRLPRTLATASDSIDAAFTQAVPSSTSTTSSPPTIPRYFFEIGQLQVALTPTGERNETNDTGFWLVVVPDRHVWAFWNPLGTDPMDQVLTPSDEGYVAGLLSSAGIFPGISSCAAVRFDITIDDLLHADQASRTLNLTSSNLVTLPTGAKIEFGGAVRPGVPQAG